MQSPSDVVFTRAADCGVQCCKDTKTVRHTTGELHKNTFSDGMFTPTVSRQHPAQTPARRFAKGHVSGSETWSFIMQKTMFCKAKGHVLQHVC